MKMRTFFAAALAGLALAAFGSRAAETRAATTSPGGIAWFGTWEAGLREAKRTGRPILLVSAAPHCHNVSGLW